MLHDCLFRRLVPDVSEAERQAYIELSMLANVWRRRNDLLKALKARRARTFIKT